MLLGEWDMNIAIDVAKEEAREDGREEGKIDVARNLRDMGLSVLQIAKATGLSEQQIEIL